ncbi:hypothetical protein GMOD_00008061 [Pyrenophora seminiperda CCB06]|uniref:Uncharacterized protein n=1 Tax=Pyrenophora seminiperda CCB06 TaxID=1302712 RepID=A0A3M7MGF8_9PLEO|nr:hypothetical protein GMOD_00008061 [Pyrenophora seminiperda CCB06]
MSDNTIVKSVAGTCITFSFILAGNAITQSYMTVPALLVSFPPRLLPIPHRPRPPPRPTMASLLDRRQPILPAHLHPRFPRLRLRKLRRVPRRRTGPQ